MKPDFFSLKIVLVAFFLSLFYAGCDLFQKDEDEEEPKEGFTETLFINPEDGQIIQYDSAGRKATFIGEKDSEGLPTKITQAIVDGEDLSEESRTVITFDDQGRTTSLSSEANGYMTLEYVSDTQVVVVYTLPDHMESFQITFNPQSAKKVGDCGCPGVRKETETSFTRRSDANAPVVQQPPRQEAPPVSLKSGLELEGDIHTYFNQTVNPVTGNTVLGMWEAPDGKTGALKIIPEGPGKFNYFFPSNPAPPPPAGFSDKAKNLLTLLCMGAIPITLAKEQICLSFTAGFAACEAILTAYVWLCRANSVHTIGTFTYDIYSAKSIHVFVNSLHPNLPAKRGETNFSPSGSSLPEINIVYDAYAVIGNLTTSPPDPDPNQGYTIYATILNVIPGIDQAKLSMVGSDGYTKEQTFELDASGVCSMFIPGALEGVRDDITAEVINQYPQPGQTVTISIIF